MRAVRNKRASAPSLKNARIAAEAARQRRAEAEREAEENRRYAEQQAEQQQQSQMINPLQVLQGMAATINAEPVKQLVLRQFIRRLLLWRVVLN